MQRLRLLRHTDKLVIPLAASPEFGPMKFAQMFRGKELIPGDVGSERTHAHNLTQKLCEYTVVGVFLGGKVLDLEHWVGDEAYKYHGSNFICPVNTDAELIVSTKDFDEAAAKNGQLTYSNSVFNVERARGRTYIEFKDSKDYIIKVAGNHCPRFYANVCFLLIDDFKKAF